MVEPVKQVSEAYIKIVSGIMKTVKPTRLSSERNTECSDVKSVLNLQMTYIIIAHIYEQCDR